jgi:hypothetical protein
MADQKRPAGDVSDRKRLAQMQQTDLAEGRLNEDFVQWLKTSGPNWLLGVLVVLCAFMGWNWWTQKKANAVALAWEELAGASIPPAMVEIASRNEEKLTQLGPVIERVANEKLQVAIDRAFAIMSRGAMLPPAPAALHGRAVRVEFVSILQQMQRMVGIGQIERVVGFVGNLAGAHPEVLDKIDFDEALDEYAWRAGTPARILRPAGAVSVLRAERAQAAHAAQQSAQIAQMVPAMKDAAAAAELLSRADVGGESLLRKLVQP